jgi:hypothetical protein
MTWKNYILETKTFLQCNSGKGEASAAGIMFCSWPDFYDADFVQQLSIGGHDEIILTQIKCHHGNFLLIIIKRIY